MTSEVPVPLAIAQPGTIVRMTTNLGEQGRDLQFELVIDRDERLEEIDERLDVIRKVADRQRALSLLVTYRRNREDVEHKTNENKKRLAATQAYLAAADEIRKDKSLELEAALALAHGRQQEEWYASGKRGAFKPSRTRETGEIEGQIQALEEDAVKERNEKAAQIAELENEIRDGERALGKWDVLIAEQVALAREPVA